MQQLSQGHVEETKYDRKTLLLFWQLLNRASFFLHGRSRTDMESLLIIATAVIKTASSEHEGISIVMKRKSEALMPMKEIGR